jgi:putative transposase
MMRKDEWLLQHGIAGDWPCWGRMDCIHVDNAKEFRGDMLRHACERYGIELNFRPVGQPHFGGHVERFFGTMMRQLHKLPGTTFSSVKAKGEYDSEKKACFTLDEVESFISKWIVEVYHNSLHRGIQSTPLKRYKEGFSGPKGRPLPPVIADVDRLQKDFMPAVRRTIQPSGVEIDYVHYYGPELKKWVGLREAGTKRSRSFSFSRDPRDISRVYFLDPDDNEFREIPYLDTSRGPISLWELRRANQRLVEEGRRGINERLLFQKHLELLDQARIAVKKTKSARRQMQASRSHGDSTKGEPAIAPEETTEALDSGGDLAEPFDDGPVTPFSVEGA